MNDKITEEKFLEVLEDNPDKTQQQIADILGISQVAVSKRIMRLKDKIPDYAGDMIKKFAIAAAKNLMEQSNDGDTQATVKLLEMAGTYKPTSKHKLEGDGKRPLLLNIINHSSAFKDYDDAQKEKSEVST